MIKLGGRLQSNRKLYIDSYFKTNIKGAKAAEIDIGIYFYSIALNEKEAIEEADFIIKNLKAYKNTINYPIAFDFEDKQQENLSKKECTDIVIAFYNRLASAGYYPILYTNLYYMTKFFEMDRIKHIDVWEARYYNPRSNTQPPKDTTKMTIWQWTEKGRISGIYSDVDLNLCFIDYPSIIERRYLNGYIKPAIKPKATPKTTITKTQTILKKNDKVKFIGTKHYSYVNALFGKPAKPCEATILKICSYGLHRYLIKGKSVYGWVNASDIVKE
ncbi:MAG: hypothetical protein A2Y17_05995 [Clostridiales bacterium GWF2_38_85]|nr:MAG: hypothetical protein A2Y17_05995 [Clostridiales bacterium GWF2_38_85]